MNRQRIEKIFGVICFCSVLSMVLCITAILVSSGIGEYRSPKIVKPYLIQHPELSDFFDLKDKEWDLAQSIPKTFRGDLAIIKQQVAHFEGQIQECASVMAEFNAKYPEIEKIRQEYIELKNSAYPLSFSLVTELFLVIMMCILVFFMSLEVVGRCSVERTKQ